MRSRLPSLARIPSRAALPAGRLQHLVGLSTLNSHRVFGEHEGSRPGEDVRGRFPEAPVDLLLIAPRSTSRFSAARTVGSVKIGCGAFTLDALAVHLPPGIAELARDELRDHPGKNDHAPPPALLEALAGRRRPSVGSRRSRIRPSGARPRAADTASPPPFSSTVSKNGWLGTRQPGWSSARSDIAGLEVQAAIGSGAYGFEVRGCLARPVPRYGSNACRGNTGREPAQPRTASAS